MVILESMSLNPQELKKKLCSNLYTLAMNCHNQGKQGNFCRPPCGEWLGLLERIEW